MLVLPELPLALKSISNQEIMSGEFLPGNGVGRGKFLSCGIHLYSLGGGWWWLQETQETIQLLVWGLVRWKVYYHIYWIQFGKIVCCTLVGLISDLITHL